MRPDSFAPLALIAAPLLAGCGTSARAQGPEPVVVVGDAGKPKPAPKTLTPDEARAKAIEEAKKFGMIGLIHDGSAEKLDFGASDDDSFGGGGVVGGVVGGMGGIGLKGTGGGVTGESIGIGSLGSIGRGAGTFGVLHGSTLYNDRIKAKLETPTVEGPLLPDVIQRILGDHHEDMQDCYQLELGRLDSHPRGRITLVFTIDPKGEVSEVQIPESTFAAPYLQGCIAQAFGTFKFPTPSPSGDVKVTAAIVF